MNNQFFYTYKDTNGVGAQGSFNINKIIRTYSTENEGRVVILDDLHEEYGEVNVNPSGKAPKIEIRKVEVVSQVFLNKEDAERFKSITEIK